MKPQQHKQMLETYKLPEMVHCYDGQVRSTCPSDDLFVDFEKTLNQPYATIAAAEFKKRWNNYDAIVNAAREVLAYHGNGAKDDALDQRILADLRKSVEAA